MNTDSEKNFSHANEFTTKFEYLLGSCKTTFCLGLNPCLSVFIRG